MAQKAGLDFFKPVKPNTIAKSLAIGTADGFYALRVMRDTQAAADDVTDDEIRMQSSCSPKRKVFLPRPPAV